MKLRNAVQTLASLAGSPGQVNLLDEVVDGPGASAVLQGLDRNEEFEVHDVGIRAVRYYLYAIYIEAARSQQLDSVEHTVRTGVVLLNVNAVVPGGHFSLMAGITFSMTIFL